MGAGRSVETFGAELAQKAIAHAQQGDKPSKILSVDFMCATPAASPSLSTACRDAVVSSAAVSPLVVGRKQVVESDSLYDFLRGTKPSTAPKPAKRARGSAGGGGASSSTSKRKAVESAAAGSAHDTADAPVPVALPASDYRPLAADDDDYDDDYDDEE